MNRRDKIKDLYAVTTESEKLAMANPSHQPERLPAGPVRSMGLALDRVEEEKLALQRALATGLTIVELDPDLVEPSIIRDRLSGSGGANFESFRQSIAERGQEIPILVRPHPTLEGRYQVAYGHRRLKAVSSLGRKVRAIVRAMSDIELVVAQGVENSQREDLSYIERALFAARLEDRGFERSVIIDALGTDKGELSKLISVARGVPEQIIEAIGSAPKAGRRRWLALAEHLKDSGAKRSATQAAKEPSLPLADTDTRFVRVFAAATAHRRSDSNVINWKSSTGRASAKVTRSDKALNLVFDLAIEPNFGEFVAAQLDDLYQTFLSQVKARV